MQQALAPHSASVQPLRPRPEQGLGDGRGARLSLLLLRELQHRTANMLNASALLLDVHARRGTESQVAFREVADSLRGMIRANQRLVIPDLDTVADAATEIRGAFIALAGSFAATRPDIRFDCVVHHESRFPVRPAGVLGLILSELVTNAFKHAFRGRTTGYLLVTLTPATRGQACLSVIDDGPGSVAGGSSAGTGLGIVQALAEMINGEVLVSGGGRLGCKVCLTFPSSDDSV